MNVQQQNKLSPLKADDTLILPIFNDGGFSGLQTNVDKSLLSHLKKENAIKNIKKNKCFAGHYFQDKNKVSFVVISLGDKDKLSLDKFREVSGVVSRQVVACEPKKLIWVLPKINEKKCDLSRVSQAISEGSVMGSYSFDKLSTEKKDKPFSLKELCICHESLTSKKNIKDGVIIAQAVNYARDLSNTPANILTPKEVVSRVKKELKGSAVTVEVIDKAKAEKLEMGAFLSVAQGSINEPYMLVLKYTPQKNKDYIALVGKGVTFDSGGISLKPSKGMSDMKADMGGAAAVIGAMLAISKLKPKKNVMVIVPLVENMPSATATRPGDVVTAMNGKTIEILNTDAEGRLILADAIYYASKQKVSEIINIATLTGASIVALGNEACALFGTDEKVKNKLKAAAEFTGDKVWELPLYEGYLPLLDSPVADISNCYEGGKAGTCTAAKFLEQFINGKPWAHIDMATMMKDESTSGYRVKGMSGAGVRNFVDYILN